MIAFDVDPDSMDRLQQAFPGWEVQAVRGATAASLCRDRDPGAAALLVVGARDRVAETLALCRGLRSQVGRAKTPLLVLLRAAQDAVVPAALAAGADSCRLLPVHAQELPGVVARVRAGNRPGRHTTHLDRAQEIDGSQDEGGEA